MQEQEFFNHGHVRVTNARFMVNGQTYAMNGVTSVKHGKKDPARGWPIFLLLLGAGMLLAPNLRMFGFPILIIAALWLFAQSTEHTVLLSSASGESKALTSTNEAHIRQIIEALNQAIIHRG